MRSCCGVMGSACMPARAGIQALRMISLHEPGSYYGLVRVFMAPWGNDISLLVAASNFHHGSHSELSQEVPESTLSALTCCLSQLWQKPSLRGRHRHRWPEGYTAKMAEAAPAHGWCIDLHAHKACHLR